MAAIHPANDKLREAEFFFMMMERHFHQYEFKYFVSALLSALSSSTEHNRLHSPDPRFKEWYREIVGNYVAKSELPGLDRLRNKEIHQKGTETLQRVGFGDQTEIQLPRLTWSSQLTSAKASQREPIRRPRWKKRRR